MYTRQVDGKELELGVSGKLYKDALVMYDRETGTLWTQVDGKALRGPLAGKRLVAVPAMQTTWRVWKRLHPNTLVLRKPATVRGSPYEDYFADSNRRGLFGTRGDSRLEGKTLILGIESGEEAVAIPLATLEKKLLLEITLAGQPIVVSYSRASLTPAVFRARLDDRTLSFRLVSKEKETFLEDAGTHSLWLPLEGRAVQGPLTDKQLEPVPYMRSYWYAWSAYRPKTSLVQ